MFDLYPSYVGSIEKVLLKTLKIHRESNKSSDRVLYFSDACMCVDASLCSLDNQIIPYIFVMWLYATTLVCQTFLLKDGIHGIYIEKVHMFFNELTNLLKNSYK
jgi:hypothetical protein